jgi:predicted DsbA family dithiol-disulfide isomerase
MADSVGIDIDISLDKADADRLGVRGTPTFLVNDILVTGYESTEVLDSLVRSMTGATERHK